MILKRIASIKKNSFYTITLVLSLISLLPLVIPVMYIDGHPIYMTGYEDSATMHIYINVLDVYRLGYLPLFMSSIGLLLLSIIGLMFPELIILDYIFIFLIAYTSSTISVIKVLTNPIPSQIGYAISGFIFTLTFKEIKYTFLYYILQYPLFIAGLFLSVMVGVYIFLSREHVN